VIDALFLEYETQTRDRRLYAQSMMVAAGFVVAASTALIAAWAQGTNLGPLVLVAPLMLAGGELVLVLRIHLLRVSVYLTLVEEDIRTRLGERTLPIAWESTMSADIGAIAKLSSAARRAPGLSIKFLLVAGVLAAVFFLILGSFVLLSDNGFTQSLQRDLINVTRPVYVAAYLILNSLIILVVVATWRGQTQALVAAQEHFLHVRRQLRELPNPGNGFSGQVEPPLRRNRSALARFVSLLFRLLRWLQD
jgi:hypothetical protein